MWNTQLPGGPIHEEFDISPVICTIQSLLFRGEIAGELDKLKSRASKRGSSNHRAKGRLNERSARRVCSFFFYVCLFVSH